MAQHVFALLVAVCGANLALSVLIEADYDRQNVSAEVASLLETGSSLLHEPSAEDFPFRHMNADEIKTTVSKEGKPAMILVTTATCPACKGLYKSMSESPTMKNMMSQLVSVHLGEGQDWKTNRGIPEGYVPRVYFVTAAGNAVEMYANRGDHPKYGYSFTQSKDLEEAMTRMLGLPATAGADVPSEKPHLLEGGECKDDEGQCSSWAMVGQCTLNARYMDSSCRKACGDCVAP